MRVLRRGPSPRGFLLRWTFILCTVAVGILLQSEASAGARTEDDFADLGDPEEDDFAEFDLDEDEFERVKKEPPPKVNQLGEEDEEDEDEFEDDEFESEPSERRKPLPGDDDDGEEAAVEEEDDEEFAHFSDDEEFEGYNNDEEGGGSSSKSSGKPPPPQTINIAKVPAHLSRNWENYLLEILMAAGIVVYFLNFFTGKSKNQRIATVWFDKHKALLESNFALVGDDGAKDVDDIETQMVKESEHAFTLWCSGRTGCEGMAVDVKLIKRQDLVSVIANLMKPANDQIQVKVHMNPEDMDTFVFCVAQKKTAARLAKEMGDLNTFCPERRAAEKYGAPERFSVMSEIAEVAAAMFDSKMTAILNKYPDAVDSIHFSDQYTGPKPSDDTVVTELPEGKKVLIFTFNLNMKNGVSIDDAVENIRPLMLLVFYFMDKVKRYRLTREAKNKAEKNRSKVTEAFWKSIHAARAERAQEERERKRREVKERIREIEDPDRQRKMEDRENRRDKKKSQPKMKQMKVKAM